MQGNFLNDKRQFPDAGSDGVREFLSLNEEMKRILQAQREILGGEESAEEKMMQLLELLCEAYHADWTGILTADEGERVWKPRFWVYAKRGRMAKTRFHPLEVFGDYPRWEEALSNNQPLVYVAAGKEFNEEGAESTQYKRLNVQCILGVPFGPRPTGFLVVRNAERFCDQSMPAEIVVNAAVNQFQRALQEGAEEKYLEPDAGDTLDIEEDRVHAEGVQDDETDEVWICMLGAPEIRSGNKKLTWKQLRSSLGWQIVFYLAYKKIPADTGEIAEALCPIDKEVEAFSKDVGERIFRFRDKLVMCGLEDWILIHPDKQGYTHKWSAKVKFDVDVMEELLECAKKTPPGFARRSQLERIQEIYRGPVCKKFSDEDWIRALAGRCSYVYRVSTDMLLDELWSEEDYPCIRRIASESLKKSIGNVDTYFSLISAEYILGIQDQAHIDYIKAQHALSEEEMDELNHRIADAVPKWKPHG